MVDANLLIIGPKIAFLLGITNVVFMLAVFFSCRCMVGMGFVNKMLKNGWYRKYYDYHCYYWMAFFLSVILHVIVVFYIFGNPF